MAGEGSISCDGMKKTKSVDHIGETTHMIPFTFHEYGARGHRSGSGGAVEANSYTRVVHSDRIDVDKERARIVDEIWARLKASSADYDDIGSEPAESGDGAHGTTRLRDAA